MSTRQPTPEAFARVLGLANTSPETYIPKLPTKQKRDEADTFVETMIVRWAEPQRRAFSEEFAAHYYPQFLRLYNELPLDIDSVFFSTLTTLAFWQGGLAVGGRFVREYPQLACSYWLNLLDRISRIPEDSITGDHNDLPNPLLRRPLQGLLSECPHLHSSGLQDPNSSSKDDQQPSGSTSSLRSIASSPSPLAIKPKLLVVDGSSSVPPPGHGNQGRM